MSTNIGLTNTNNPTFFSKPKPIDLSGGTITFENTIPTAQIDQVMVKNEVLKTLNSLNKIDPVNPNIDDNPLDNIIRNEVINLLSYRKISKSKINIAKDLISQGQDPFPIFEQEENIVLLTQARLLEKITEFDYLRLSASPINLWFEFPQIYMDMLDFQLLLPNTIPTIDELKMAGMVEFIIDTIRTYPGTIIDTNLINQFTKKYLDDTLLKTEFIGYEKANRIYTDPNSLLNILSKIEVKYFLNRIKPYLSFITDAKILQIESLLPSEYILIGSIFTETQIRLMIDKELDIKSTILKTLTLEEVQKVFNVLALQFKNDFTETFSNEKLIELIELVIINIFPLLNQLEIYNYICSKLHIEINESKINTIEDYINNYFN